MKWLCISLIVVILILSLWPTQPESQLYIVRSKMVDSFMSIMPFTGKNKKEIALKKGELKAYEEALQKAETEIARMQSEVGTCPITGQPNKFILEQDPRPEIQTKIENLKEEIRLLEKS